ncbi:hypothetical protein [Actinacidiphila yeochonensis]|uniref:hypothetical protein n=1 Tax=Actinacidiphila yeochonensis TaxID=89050 RepID=UPI00068E722A|nr:hypothetical protein [Actinacidiphila yeochonensis]
MERWSLDSPEPYTVALPEGSPEAPDTRVLPLPDGRVLAARPNGGGADLVLLYPSGAGTGSLAVGSLAGTEVRLLPASAVGAFATAYDGSATEVWRVCGASDRVSAGGLVRLARVPGRCTGGVWLDRDGRLLALDRELGGRTKSVAVDLGSGTVSPLLQLSEASDDRLLLAEPDSGLMLVRSDATGEDRLGWGVLGSRHPVRFPEALRLPGALLTPVAAQPGQILTPEAAVVALRCEVPGGERSLALWRPGGRTLHWRAVPRDWLGPVALWLPSAPLRLPAAPRPSSPTTPLPPTAPTAPTAPTSLAFRALPPGRPPRSAYPCPPRRTGAGTPRRWRRWSAVRAGPRCPASGLRRCCRCSRRR